MSEEHLHTFENGIRLIHKEVPHTKVAHCGFMLDIGSRDESFREQGLAHFWEHMAFKGTQKRRAFHVINRLETVGGDLNAYTTKEKICFYASLLSDHFEKAVELLTDITFHSSFPEKEIAKERGVILEEMSMYEDDPADAIQDEFDALVFGEHPLGRNILGTRESVSGFNRADFQGFIQKRLNTNAVVLSSVSNWPFEKVKRVVSKYLEEIPKMDGKIQREDFSKDQYSPQLLSVQKPISQAHCILGGLAYPLNNKNRLPFALLINLLGGNGMNSRLNMSVREKNGLAYGIYANYTPFLDVGMYSIQFATEYKTLNRCLELIERELSKLQQKKLGRIQLHTAKQQFMGQIAMAEESNQSLMLAQAKATLDYEKLPSLAEVFDTIERVDANLLQQMAIDIFDPSQKSQLLMFPEE